MSQPSLKKNFAYKGLLTIANPIMGMITFPYISRILGVENVGLVNFVDNTINYFLLFATLGIGTLGVRSIASARTSQEELNKTFSNIFGLNLLFTFATLMVYIGLIFFIPKFSDNSELFYIGAAKILFTSLLIEWFFSGIENFKYITIRTLLIRAIYIVSVFLFIKDPSDYKIYFLLTIATIVINAIINQVYSRRYVKIVFRELFSTRFMKENIMLGIYSIMTSMYLTFNVMFLGLVSTNIEVGYYTSAFKLYYLILSVFTAFTSVMMPRMSALLSDGDEGRFQKLISKSFTFVSLVALPLAVCGSIMAPEIIYILCGPGYQGAILPMRVIMPAILLVGIAQILAIQTLLPMKKDKVLLIASIIGAVVSVVINVTLVPQLASLGSAIVLLTSEFVVTAVYIAYVGKNRLLSIPWKSFIRPLITVVPCALLCIGCSHIFSNDFMALGIAIASSMLIYFILNYKVIKHYFI